MMRDAALKAAQIVVLWYKKPVLGSVLKIDQPSSSAVENAVCNKLNFTQTAWREEGQYSVEKKVVVVLLNKKSVA